MTSHQAVDAGFRALQTHLAQWNNRRRWETLLAWLPRVLAAALLPGLMLALLARTRPLLTAAEIAALTTVIALATVAATAIVILVRQRTLLEQARFADRRFRLRERATAAVEIHAGRHAVDGALAARQLDDTLVAAAAVDLAQEMPLTTRAADWLPAALALLFLALALWLPNPQQALLRQQRAVAAAVGEQVAALEDLAADIAADPALTPEQREALHRPLEEALTALSEPDISQAEAMATLSEAEAELRSLGEAFDHAAVGALGRSEPASELAQALQSAQAGAAADAAAELAEALPQLDDAARSELADNLAAAADAIAAVDPALAGQLERTASALAEGDTPAAQEALGELSGDLSEAASAAEAASDQAGRAADQLGQARQSVAAAGASASQRETTGAGTPGEGEAGQTSQNGQSGEDDQSGEGGQSGEGQTGQGAGSQSSATGGPSEGGGHVENIFVPSPIDLSGQGQDLELEVQCLGDPAACGAPGEQLPGAPEGTTGGSFVPFDQVFGDYRDAAFETLPGSGIPPALQGLVRDYFSALEP